MGYSHSAALHSEVRCGAVSRLIPRGGDQLPKGTEKEARVLSGEGQRQFVSCLRADMDVCRFGILLALLTGLRIGELCATLRWENVSLRNKTIHVGATMQRLRDMDNTGEGKTKGIISSPKSSTSIRTIPLTK